MAVNQNDRFILSQKAQKLKMSFRSLFDRKKTYWNFSIQNLTQCWEKSELHVNGWSILWFGITNPSTTYFSDPKFKWWKTIFTELDLDLSACVCNVLFRETTRLSNSNGHNFKQLLLFAKQGKSIK